MGGLCSMYVKGDKVFAKSDGHSDNHKSNGKNHNSTNMPSDLTSARDHGLDKKKQEVAATIGNGSNEYMFSSKFQRHPFLVSITLLTTLSSMHPFSNQPNLICGFLKKNICF